MKSHTYMLTTHCIVYYELVLWLRINGDEHPFGRDRSFPVLAGYNASGGKCNIARIWVDNHDVPSVFTYVVDGARNVSFVGRDGRRRTARRFVLETVLVIVFWLLLAAAMIAALLETVLVIVFPFISFRLARSLGNLYTLEPVYSANPNEHNNFIPVLPKKSFIQHQTFNTSNKRASPISTGQSLRYPVRWKCSLRGSVGNSISHCISNSSMYWS